MNFRTITRVAEMPGLGWGTHIESHNTRTGRIVHATFVSDCGRVIQMESDGAWPEYMPKDDPLQGCFIRDHK